MVSEKDETQVLWLVMKRNYRNTVNEEVPSGSYGTGEAVDPLENVYRKTKHEDE
jgi:hypothetical protein